MTNFQALVLGVIMAWVPSFTALAYFAWTAESEDGRVTAQGMPTPLNDNYPTKRPCSLAQAQGNDANLS